MLTHLYNNTSIIFTVFMNSIHNNRVSMTLYKVNSVVYSANQKQVWKGKKYGKEAGTWQGNISTKASGDL